MRAGPASTPLSGSLRYDVVQDLDDLDLRRATPADGREVLMPRLVLPAELGVVVAGQDGSAPGRAADPTGVVHAWTLPRGPGPAPDESELVALETDRHRAHPPSLAQAGLLRALYPPANASKLGSAEFFGGSSWSGPAPDGPGRPARPGGVEWVPTLIRGMVSLDAG